MFVEQLKSGARVQIQRPGDGASGGYMCKVEVLIPNSREVLVHAPLEKGKLVRLAVGDNFTLKLMSDNAIYRYKATLVAYANMDGFDVVKFRLLDSGEKVQRRSAFRFNCAIPVTFNIIYSTGKQSEAEEGLIIDLSAGGCKMNTNNSLNTGTLINIGLQLGDDLVVAFGDIRMKKELPRSDSKCSYQYGIRFTMMPESDQERIIRFMYKMQREDLKRARPR